MKTTTRRFSMVDALEVYLTAAHHLCDSWDQILLTKTEPSVYPAYLPSFDEHVAAMETMRDALRAANGPKQPESKFQFLSNDGVHRAVCSDRFNKLADLDLSLGR